jgi:geranylgeranyl reductase
MKMISPSNKEVDVGKTLNDKEWIGMFCPRHPLDALPTRVFQGGRGMR